MYFISSSEDKIQYLKQILQCGRKEKSKINDYRTGCQRSRESYTLFATLDIYQNYKDTLF